jgi:hypothetical protein
MAIGMGFSGGLNSLGDIRPSTGGAMYPSPNDGAPAQTNPYLISASQDPWAQAANASAQGNLTGAQIATQANRVNQSTPYGSLNYSQSVDANGNPTWSANQSLNPAFQPTFNSLATNAQNAAATPFAAGPAVNTGINTSNLPSYGINPSESYTDAIMRRLQPNMANAQESFDVKMANQGIPVGSEAYNRAYRNFSQGQNDQLTSAVVGGMQTGLQANQQAYNQQANQVGLNLQGNQQAFNQNLAAYNNPLAQLNSFQTATQPNYVNPYTQAATAGPDYLGAAGLSNQNAIANQNMATANRSNLTSGLFNLAGTGALAYALS